MRASRKLWQNNGVNNNESEVSKMCDETLGCEICDRPFKQGDKVMHVVECRYLANENAMGDYEPYSYAYYHVDCLKNKINK
jgi:hypothetical protein